MDDYVIYAKTAAKMDAAEVLQNMITNKYMSQFDYVGTEFVFKTICHRGSFSYCICECGIQHEYLDYITEFGDIDENVFQKVVTCIANGKCEHAGIGSMPSEYVQETRIYPLHILAAIPAISQEIEAQIESLSKDRVDRLRSGLLGITPYEMAILRNNLSYITSKRTYINPSVLMISRQTEANETATANFHKVSFHEFCVEESAHQILEDTVDNFGFGFTVIDSAPQAALQQNQTDSVEFIVSNRKWFKQGIGAECCALAVMYDQPKYLRKLLMYLSDDVRQSDRLCKLCNTLERWKCKTVLSENGCALVKEEPMSESAKKKELLYEFRSCRRGGLGELLEIYCPYFKSLPSTSLQKIIVNLWIEIIDSTHWDLDDFFDHDFFYHLSDAVSLESWINTLSDVNHEYSDGSTPLLDLISETCDDILSFRRCLEMYIYQNPNVDLYESVVKLGIKSDKRFYSKKPSRHLYSGIYVIDGKPHGICGHDDNPVLNMTGPFLMECGFLVLDKVYKLVESRKDELPSKVYAYVQNYSSTPKTLKTLCRETLRRHFRGREIHRFVEIATIPQMIADYILLKPLFRCLPKDLNLYG